MAYITCKDLVVGYDGKSVSEHINFSVGKGDYLCIVGENGAGKSTLMKTLLHLIEPISGTIEYGDEMRTDEIGYLPQQTQVQKDFPASVSEIVLSGRLSRSGKRPFYTKEDKAIAGKMMEELSIYDIRRKCYRNLSGGQQQRVLLARALCAAAKLIILDEPVSGLDPKATAEMYALIKRLNKDGISVIMVTHDMMAAVSYASHILHIDKVQQYYGDVEGYLESCAFKQIGGLGGGTNEHY